jgi:hypothetical protein
VKQGLKGTRNREELSRAQRTNIVVDIESIARSKSNNAAALKHNGQHHRLG